MVMAPFRSNQMHEFGCQDERVGVHAMTLLPILVVEDDDSLRETSAELLRTHGYVVEAVEDAFAALAFLRENDVAALILDVYMPGMNGLTLLDHLDDPPPTALITGHSYDTEVMDRRSKVSLFLQKPVSPVHLLEAADDLMRRSEEGGRPPNPDALAN